MSQRHFPSYLIFQHGDEGWRWNFASPKGRVIAGSAVSYPNPEGCVRAIRLMQGSSDVSLFLRRADDSVVKIGQRPIAQEPTRSAAVDVLDLDAD